MERDVQISKIRVHNIKIRTIRDIQIIKITSSMGHYNYSIEGIDYTIQKT